MHSVLSRYHAGAKTQGERTIGTDDTHPADGEVSTRALMTGAIGWLVFCLVAVAVRGVRWDETYEFAQIVLGSVEYPDHHPLNRYVRGVYTGQHYLSSLVVWITGSAWLLSYLRNVLFLFMAIVPVFLLTARLTKFTIAGHVAALFLLLNVLVPFETSYPMRVWPHSFSNGPIASGWILFCVYFIVARKWPAALLMTTLTPVMHLGQFPPLLCMAVFCVLVTLAYGERRDLVKAWPWAVAGLTVCGAVGIAVTMTRVGAPTAGPYFVEGDGMAIWRNYKEVWYHTSFRGVHEWIHSDLLLAASLVIGFGASISREEGPWLRRQWTWLLAFCTACAGAVWIARGFHWAMGTEVPWLIVGWIPYRVANLVPPLLLAMCVTLLWTTRGKKRQRVNRNALKALVAGSVAVFAIGDGLDILFYQRYLADGAWIVFALVGLSVGQLRHELVMVQTPRARVAFLAATFAGLAYLATQHQFAVACIVAATGIGWVAPRYTPRPLERTRHVGWVVVAIGIVVLLVVEGIHRGAPRAGGFDIPYGRSEFDIAVTAYLEEHGGPSAMLVTDNYAPFIQSRTGHPVLAHWMLDSFSIYMPDYGPAIQRLYREVYGISYGESPTGGIPNQPKVWQAAWSARSQAEWRALGEHYDFRHVIAPAHVTMSLQPVVEIDNQVLYEIPPEL